MKHLGTILILIFAAVALAWGGFIAGRSWRENSIRKCAKGFGECMILLERVEEKLKHTGYKLDDCRLKLPRE